MKNVFLVLAIAGAVIPYFFFLDFLNGQGLLAFVPALFVNGAAGGFAADLLISSLVFWLFLLHQGVEKPWVYILVNLLIGLSCALPLYCYISMRSEGALTGSHQ